jgi:hypothetical protein
MTPLPTYTPDRWVVLRISLPKSEPQNTPLYKVFASFHGGYARGDSWKLNSGITQITPAPESNPHLRGGALDFHGASGSIYRCYPEVYGTHFYGQGVLEGFIHEAKERGGLIEVLPKETHWLSLLPKVS